MPAATTTTAFFLRSAKFQAYSPDREAGSASWNTLLVSFGPLVTATRAGRSNRLLMV
jgi:hypothetical protein